MEKINVTAIQIANIEKRSTKALKTGNTKLASVLQKKIVALNSIDAHVIDVPPIPKTTENLDINMFENLDYVEALASVVALRSAAKSYARSQRIKDNK